MTGKAGRSGHGVDSVLVHLSEDSVRPFSERDFGLRAGARAAHRILVVDDLPASRYPTVRSLQHAGFQTLEVEAGMEALANAAVVSAVVLDVNLPDVNGVAVCSMLKESDRYKHLPVILTSAFYADEVHMEAGRQAGAAAYMVAPFDFAELVANLDRLLGIA